MAKDNIAPLMASYGFALKRRNKHRIWQHPTGAQIVTPSTASDWRVTRNIERDIKRVLCAT